MIMNFIDDNNELERLRYDYLELLERNKQLKKEKQELLKKVKDLFERLMISSQKGVIANLEYTSIIYSKYDIEELEELIQKYEGDNDEN